MSKDAFDKVEKRDLLRIPDICRQVLVGHHEPVNAFDEVGNITETPRLFSVAINRQRHPAQRLKNEVRQCAAVVQTHPRPIGIEDSHDARVHFMIAVIRHGHGFGKALGFIINAARANGVHVSPVVFVLWRNFRVAVTFAGGSKKKLRILGPREAQSIVRAERPHLQRGDGHLEVIHRACGRGKVQHVVHGPGHVDVLGNIRALDPELRILEQVRDIAVHSGDQIVQGQHIPALRDQPVAQVRSQETGPPGNHCAHEASFALQPINECTRAPGNLTTASPRDSMPKFLYGRFARLSRPCPAQKAPLDHCCCRRLLLHGAGSGRVLERRSMAGGRRPFGKSTSDCRAQRKNASAGYGSGQAISPRLRPGGMAHALCRAGAIFEGYGTRLRRRRGLQRTRLDPRGSSLGGHSRAGAPDRQYRG